MKEFERMNTIGDRGETYREIECILHAFLQDIFRHCLADKMLQYQPASADKIHVQDGGNIIQRCKLLREEQALVFPESGNNSLWKSHLLFRVFNIDELHTLYFQSRFSGSDFSGACQVRTADVNETGLVLQVVSLQPVSGSLGHPAVIYDTE